MKKVSIVQYINETAVFATLVFIGVYSIKIPMPYGYFHMGDSMIILAALMLSKKQGALASGIGAALADLLSGWVIWVIPTFIFKFAMAFTITTMLEKHAFKLKGRALLLVSSICGGIVQFIGYGIGWSLMFGKAGLIAGLPGLCLQIIIGIIIAFIIAEILEKTPLKYKFLYLN